MLAGIGERGPLAGGRLVVFGVVSDERQARVLVWRGRAWPGDWCPRSEALYGSPKATGLLCQLTLVANVKCKR